MRPLTLDVDYWSDGQLSAIWQEAEALESRVRDEADPADHRRAQGHFRTVGGRPGRPSLGRGGRRPDRQWASQVRVNMAEMVVDVLEPLTGYVCVGGDVRRR